MNPRLVLERNCSCPGCSPCRSLAKKDHCAIVLRFFEGKDLKQVGAALGVSENTAKSASASHGSQMPPAL